MACVCTCLATLVNTDITCALGFIINRVILNNMASVKILHEVMPCIYKQGDEKPAMKWSFIINHGLASRTKIYEVCPRYRRLRARSWLARPMRERQGREQCLQGNVMSGVVVEAARAFLLCLLSLSEFLLSASNWAAAWWIVWRQATRSAARSDHCLWSMLQVVSDLFRLSLNRFFGAPLSRWPVESSPYKTIFGRRWSSILET